MVNTIDVKKYEIIREIGSGGFSEVYLARCKKNNSEVAIKVLKKTDDDNLKRFRKESKNYLELIDNRFVVDIVEYNDRAKYPYIVLEYCNGGSLRNFVGKMTWEECVIVLGSVINGIKGIHEAGGFHRDIKPENILVSIDSENNKHYKLSDFGLSRNHMTSTMTHNPFGTKGYIAPEHDVLSDRYSKESDIYSLGITCVELLTGIRDRKKLNKIGIPNRFKKLLHTMTNINPEKRPNCKTIAEELYYLINNRNLEMAKNTTKPGFYIIGAVAIITILLLVVGNNDSKWKEFVKR